MVKYIRLIDEYSGEEIAVNCDKILMIQDVTERTLYPNTVRHRCRIDIEDHESITVLSNYEVLVDVLNKE